jgi:hypothetical protein
MADCVAAQVARERAVQRGTHEKQDRAWRRWKEYLESIGIKSNDFLENFSREQRHSLIGAFALAVREARFSRSAHDPLVASTVSGTIQCLCSTFRENGYPNPTLDEDGQFAFILQRELRSFKNLDPPEKHQAAVPMSVISAINKRNSSELEQATAQLVTLGIFFAMRSCEYLKVHQAEQHRTDIVRLRDIRFFRGGEQLDHNNLKLEYADCVSITFERQKKDEKMDTITQMASGDRTLCPVRAAAAIVKRIKKYPGASLHSPISTVLNHGIIEHVTSNHVIDVLRDAVGAIGEARLGFKKEDVGMHSIRSGAAMAMYLGECPVFMIMLIERWSSDAFLRYIQKQVMEFSQNVAKKMLSCQNFRHIPNIHMRIPSDDPRIRNHPNNAETRKNVGGDSSRCVRLPPFALYN